MQVLRTPCYDNEAGFIIQCDASDYGIGACLAQSFSDGEHPLAYASCKLSPTQRNWATIEKEAFAIIFALKKFDDIVYGRKITVFSDHNPLKFLSDAVPKSSKLTRWSLAL